MKFRSRLAATYIRRNIRVLTLIILIGVLQNCITFLLPVSIGEYFSLQYHSGGSKSRLLEIVGIHFSSLQSFFFFFLGLLLLKGITSQAERWLSFKEGEKFVKMTREKLFYAQLNQPPAIFQRKAYGNYLLRYSNDLRFVKNYLVQGVLGAFKNSLFLFTGFIILGMINLLLSFYLILLFSLFLAGFFILARYQRRFIQKSRDKRSNLLEFVTRSFSRYDRIKEINSEEQTINRFNEKSGQLFKANLANYRWESLQESGIPFLQYAMLGGLLFLTTAVTPVIGHGDALVFVLVTLMLFSAMRKILRVPGTLNKGIISLKKVEELITQKAVPEKENIVAQQYQAADEQHSTVVT